MDNSFPGTYNEIVRVHFKPTTHPGKWSAWLIAAFAISLGAFYILVASGQRGGDTFFSNPILTAPILLAATSGIAAFIIGLFSIIKRKERSIAVFIAIAVGFIVLFVSLAQIPPN
jgi:hypothetical protein